MVAVVVVVVIAVFVEKSKGKYFLVQKKSLSKKLEAKKCWIQKKIWVKERYKKVLLKKMLSKK